MFINPPNTPLTVNIPGNEQLCGPALSVEECKDDDWMKLNFPHSFNSQGDCVQFVLHRQ